ncbi:glutathione S-transferase [Pseudocolwellia agarivorans]|uniref:glutathione S-transferase n=1 Tax=Pseudocolwellia agarivorans TaxID=1911682 RepID=UPI003F881117
MILYGSYTSPFVRHCRIALLSANIDFEFVDTDYASSSEKSPAKKVPFLQDGTLTLTDSSSILLHIKQKSGQAGFVDVVDFDLYTLANTALDSEINLFILGNSGVTPENNDYMLRQKNRVNACLEELNTIISSTDITDHKYSDGQLRLACLLAWGVFRNRFSLEEFSALNEFLSTINTWELFDATSPDKTS